MVEFKTLEDLDLHEIHAAFVEAFADYTVSIQMPFDKFSDMVRRRGVDLRASMGAFEGERLVGFVLNGLRDWGGVPTCYDSGTGVVPNYRGQGLSSALVDRLLPILAEMGVAQYLLEVIDENAAAIHVYEQAGFRLVRTLNCYRRDPRADLGPAALPEGVEIQPLDEPDWERFESFWDFVPSWQNSRDSVATCWADFERLCARSEDEIVGYGLIHPRSGDLPQVAVHPDWRRKGLGRALLIALFDRVQNAMVGEIKVLNVDGGNEALPALLTACGFDFMLAQREMVREIG